MIRVGLVGEDPYDTLSIKNLLEKRYRKNVQFLQLVKGIKGYNLENAKFKNALPIEIKDKKCQFVVFIRDLDAFESQVKKSQQRLKWFEGLNSNHR